MSKLKSSSKISLVMSKYLKSRNTKFQTYKSKQERSFKIVGKLCYIIRRMWTSDIRKGIEEQGHTVTNV
jgi:hypothetical protein